MGYASASSTNSGRIIGKVPAMKVVVAAIALSGLLAQAAPGQVRVWKSSDIRDKGKALAQKLDAQKVASEVIATDGNRTFMVAHREGSGQAEWHEKQADIMMISAGDVTMLYGGTIVDGKKTAEGEMRGPSIKGGTEVKLGPGDVLEIPAQVPHQMKLAPGTQVTYFVAKVVQ
jgi:mannose-6-phosphate isomerase-like protein (cupin superfamily)